MIKPSAHPGVSGYAAPADLDEDQQAVIALPADSCAVVAGSPGSGKTTALIERVATLVAGGLEPDQLVVLTPTRQGATALRDRLGLRVRRATSGSLARSVASFAFAVVRAAEVRAGREPPQLLTGSDEDAIIRDLLAGEAEDEAAGGVSRWPSSLPPQLRATSGFRAEVRAFLAECAALGFSPDRLRQLGRQNELSPWQAMAGFAEEYYRVRALMRGAYRDAAGLIREAVQLLRDRNAASALGGFADIRVILVDDAQELTYGGVELLDACRQLGIAVVAFGDPDVSAGAFRGATPENFAQLATWLGTTLVLRQAHRGSPTQVAVVDQAIERIGAVGVVHHRRGARTRQPIRATEMVGAEGREPNVQRADLRTSLLPSRAQEYDAIAHVLRERHLFHNVPWPSCAVIAHDLRQVSLLVSELSARDVPVHAPRSAAAAATSSVVRDLALTVDVALMPPELWTYDRLADVLVGAGGGFDAIGLRRLRQQARAEDRAQQRAVDDGPASGEDLVVSGCRHPVEFDVLDTAEGRKAAVLARTLAEIASAAQGGASAHELLWIAWDSSGVRRRLQDRLNNSRSLQVHRDLDAVVGLFQSAKRFGERDAAADARVFVRSVLTSAVADDQVTARQPDAVQVLTPAGALGAEFDTVVVAGLQDGVWPNTRLRGSVLQTWRLRSAPRADAADAEGTADRRRGAMHDELRLFARALSRARSFVYVTAVDDDDTGPSVFFGLLPGPERPSSIPSHPMTLRGLVACYRRVLTEPGSTPDEQQFATGQLVLLADAGVPGADPEQWYGVSEPSTRQPMRYPEQVRVSPSRVESVEACPLDWVVSDLAADPAGATAGIGTILHAALEHAVGGSVDDLWSIVKQRWDELSFDARWQDRAAQRRARDLVQRLHSYLQDFHDAGGTLLDAEPHFEVMIPLSDQQNPTPVNEGAAGPILSGYIDRVEVTADGAVVIVDLKTGKSAATTDSKVADDAQLLAYQLAFQVGAIEAAGDRPGGGAKLLVVNGKSSRAPYLTPTQPPLCNEQRERYLQRLREVVTVISGTEFVARFEEHCRDDYNYGQCRIHTIPAVSAS